jgi:hypothetical protein
MRKEIKKPTVEDRGLEGGIEWIVARQLAPIEDELLRLRAHVEAIKEAMLPW